MIETIKIHHKIHVIVKLAALLCLTIMVRKFNDITLFITLLMLATMLVLYRAPNAMRMLKRLRWLILTILLVYAFNTPGEYVNLGGDRLWPIAPTYEGVQTGVSQVLRLSVVVMALVLLLARTDRDALIGGLYTLFKPLSCFGLDPERFAVRLWLTLHYVENDRGLSSKSGQVITSFLTQIGNKFDALDVDEEMLDSITLQAEVLKSVDVFVLLIVLSMTVFYMEYF